MIFLNRVAARWFQGHFRYGSPKKRQNYMGRMEKELIAYKGNGNMEHLLNIATYCYLESIKPMNPKFNYRADVDSVTREEFGE